MAKRTAIAHQGIKELRGSLGLSQQGLAQLLGVALQTVWRWESGLAKPLPVISARLEELQRQAQSPNRRARGIPRAGSIPAGEARGRKGEGEVSGLSGLFKGFGNLMEAVSRMADLGPQGATLSGESRTPGGSLRAIWGISVRAGLGEKPIINQFGNIRETGEGTMLGGFREPLVDVFEEEGRLRVIVEVPGVEERDIRIQVRGDILEVDAGAGERTYRKEVLLSPSVDARSLESSYRNGVLEIILELTGEGAHGTGNDST